MQTSRDFDHNKATWGVGRCEKHLHWKAGLNLDISRNLHSSENIWACLSANASTSRISFATWSSTLHTQNWGLQSKEKKHKECKDARLDAETNQHVCSSLHAMYDYHLISKSCKFNKKSWGTETWNIKKTFHLHSGLSAKQLASTRSTIRRSISARFS